MKSVLIISPNIWGRMLISKHNYALELAKQGYKVFFMNPPNQNKNVNNYLIYPIHEIANLYVIDCKLTTNRVIDFLRFRLRFTKILDWFLFNLIQKISLNEKIVFDQIWSFDPNLHGYLYKYPASYKVFFIVDQISNKTHLRSAKNIDLVVSITSVILNKFSKVKSNKLLINHGLNSIFEIQAKLNLLSISPIKQIFNIGYVGNLTIKYINYSVLDEIVKNYPEINFHFWGAYNSINNNLLGSLDSEIAEKIEKIKSYKNVVFYGLRSQSEIVDGMKSMDGFLMCYDIENDPNQGANSHKILEYLSTGKVIIANRVLDYKNSDLFPMLKDTDTNKLIKLFDEVINNVEYYNSEELQRKRLNFALASTYEQNIIKIESTLKSKNIN